MQKNDAKRLQTDPDMAADCRRRQPGGGLPAQARAAAEFLQHAAANA